jgi:hypothetical protein
MVSYLSGSVRYRRDAGVTDVQTIIDNLVTEATALSPAWSNPSSGKLVSPADATGRKMTLQFTKISATNLEMTLTDGSGRTITRRAQIAAGGSAVDYYVGQFHMMLDWLNSATPEGFFAIMLDESPELQTSHEKWMVMNSSRTAADSLDSSWLFGAAYIIRSTNAYVWLGAGWLIPYLNAGLNAGFEGMMSRTVGGSNLWAPIIQMGDTVSGTYKIRGKYFQCLMIKDIYASVGSEVSLPVDDSTTVIMRVTNLPRYAPFGVQEAERLAVRKT